MENKTDYSIGHLRIKYLDYANIKFAQNDPVGSQGFVESFLDTIDDFSEAGKTLKQEFDLITLRKKQQHKQLLDACEKLSYLEKEDTRQRGQTEIEVNVIHDRKEACWRVAMKYGLFNE